MDRESGGDSILSYQNSWNPVYVGGDDAGGSPQAADQTIAPGQTNREDYGNWTRKDMPLSLSIPSRLPDPRDPAQGGSVPHTPDAPIPPPASFTQHRLGSISSIASSEDESVATASQYPWTEQQDSLIMETFDLITSDPTTAPFSGKFPPSGITHRVAHDTVKAARRQRVLFPHRLPAIRHRILVLFSRREEFDDRTESYAETDYFGNRMEGVDDEGYMSSAGDASDFNFADTHESTQRPCYSRYRETLGGVGVLPVGVTAPPSLASPFTETPPQVVPPHTMDERELSEDILNVVAKRKRDSLRLKRGLQ